MAKFDTIIIGAGHNGLVCAAYLARRGQSVLVLEAAERPGGLAAAREFHPGYTVSLAHSISHFSSRIARELKLDSYGFEPGQALPTVALDPGGAPVTIQGDTVSGVSAEDAGAFREYSRQMKEFARMLEPMWHETIPRIGNNNFSEVLTFGKMGLRLRRLGKEKMGEFLRVAALPTRDLMDENFDNDLLKAALAWDGVIGARMAPRSPNNSVLMMLYRMAGAHDGAHALPAGGIEGLIGALRECAADAGAEIRTGAPVERVLIEGGEDSLSATGVELPDGERITADRVVSSADPQRTFLDLVGTPHLEIEFSNRIRRLRCEGLVAKLHLALDGLPDFAGLERPDGRLIIAPDLDAIEFAYDDAKYGLPSENPVMEIVVPSLHDGTAAPEGKHVLSAHVMYVPYRHKGGWSDEARKTVHDRAVETLSRYAPGIGDRIVASELLTPADIEEKFNATGGHWHHTEFAMDQILMMRPTYEAAQYTTPVSGLYLCGAGCHPGGDLTGGPGRNAAREILK